MKTPKSASIKSATFIASLGLYRDQSRALCHQSSHRSPRHLVVLLGHDLLGHHRGDARHQHFRHQPDDEQRLGRIKNQRNARQRQEIIPENPSPVDSADGGFFISPSLMMGKSQVACGNFDIFR